MPPRVGPARPAEVTPALPAGWCPGTRCHGQSQPRGERRRSVPAALPFARPLPTLGWPGRLLGFLIGARVFLLLSCGLFSTFCSRRG